MSRKLLLILVVMLAMLAMGVHAVASGTDVTVTDFPGLQAAISNASVTTITITEAINVTSALTVNRPVTITAENKDSDTLSSDTVVGMFNLSGGATLRGLMIKPKSEVSSASVIQCSGDATIENCTIEGGHKDNTTNGIYSSAAGAKIVITGSTITNCYTPIFLHPNSAFASGSTITNNTINNGYGCEIYTSVANFSGNTFTNMEYNGKVQYAASIYDASVDIIAFSAANPTAFINQRFPDGSGGYLSYARAALGGNFLVRATSPYSGAASSIASLKGALQDINDNGRANTTIVLDEDYTTADAVTIGAGKTVTIDTKGKTLTTGGITVDGTLRLTGGGEVASNGLVPAITNKSTNTVYVNGVEVTGSGSIPGISCENGRVVIVSMPAGGVDIVLTQAGDSVEIASSAAGSIASSIKGDDAMVTSGSKTIFYYGLAQALNSAPAGSTVEVTGDVPGSPITLEASATLEGGVTLDLKGHTITNGINTISVPSGETVTVKSSIGTGSVVIDGETLNNVSTERPVVGDSPSTGVYYAMTISPQQYLNIVGVSTRGYKQGSAFPIELEVKAAYTSRFINWTVSPAIAGLDLTQSKLSIMPTGAMTITANFRTDPVPTPALTLTPATANLKVGETQQLTASETGITWSTSDANIATVSSTGLVTAVAEGSATITATAADSRKATCAVTVTKAADPTDPTDPAGTLASIPATYKITAGFSHQLAAANPVGAKLDLAFVTKNPAVCTIDRQGKITGVGAGKCAVGIVLNGKTYKCTVTVVANKFGRAKPLMIKGERGVFTSTRQLAYVGGGLLAEVYLYNRTSRTVRGFQQYALEIRRGDQVLYTAALPGSLSPYGKAMKSNTYKRYKTTIPADAIEGIGSKAFNLAAGELQAVIVGVDTNGNNAVPVTPATPGAAKPKAVEALAADEIKLP